MIKSILFCLIFLVLISKPTYSQTYITNDIISQTNWVISGSPYILNNSISILSNLYIDSNVVVNMNGFSMHVGSDWNNGNLSCNGVEFNSPSESQIYIYGWYSDVGSFGNCIFDKVCVGSGSYQLYLINNTFKNLIDNYPITLNPSGGAYNTSITGNNFVNCSKIGIGVGFGVVRTNFWLKNFDNLEYFLTGSGEILGGYDGVGGGSVIIDSSVVFNMNGGNLQVGSDWYVSRLSAYYVTFKSDYETYISVNGWYATSCYLGNCNLDRVFISSSTYLLTIYNNTFNNLSDNFPIYLYPSARADNTFISGNNFTNCSKIGIGVGFGWVRNDFHLKKYQDLEYFLTGSGEILGGYDGFGGGSVIIDSSVVFNMNGGSLQVGNDWYVSRLYANYVEFKSDYESSITFWTWYNTVGNIYYSIFNKVKINRMGGNNGTINISYCDFILPTSSYGFENYETSIINAENNYWSGNLGPQHSSNPNGNGCLVSDYVNFANWEPEPINYADERIPVIFIPGIMGSPLFNDVDDNNSLYRNPLLWLTDEYIWADEKQIGYDLSDSFLDVLQLNDDGITPLQSNYRIKVAPVWSDDALGIQELLQIKPLDTYYNLITSLQTYPNNYILDNFNINHSEGENLYIFTYDWRKSLLNSALELNNLTRVFTSYH